MNPVELIIKKRNGEKLGDAEIAYLVNSYTAGEIPDYQMAAFMMAYYFQDMILGHSYPDELAALTMTMAKSGATMDFSDEFDLIYDKHSTGGVGDKLSFICAPITAACGCPSFLLSGRGLGHTGGTLDKMESVPGMRVALSEKEIRDGLKKVGLVISGQTGEIAPADKKMYALRDVTGTVPSIGLISASILSKKLAVGPACLVLDVKCGSGAFMETYEDAHRLAQAMCGILRELKRPACALITDMDQPLGRAVGNSLEIAECVRILQNRCEKNEADDVIEISLALAARAILLGKKAGDIAQAQSLAENALKDGRAWEKFRAFFENQGGDVHALDSIEKSAAGEKFAVKSADSGFIHSIDSYSVGISANLLGAGRFKKEDTVDHQAGIEILKKKGDEVRKGDTLAVLHFNDPSKLQEARDKVFRAFVVKQEKPAKRERILGILE